MASSQLSTSKVAFITVASGLAPGQLSLALLTGPIGCLDRDTGLHYRRKGKKEGETERERAEIDNEKKEGPLLSQYLVTALFGDEFQPQGITRCSVHRSVIL